MIEIENLSKRYGNFLAVDSINLTIGEGEIFSFLGINGAGKTTTFSMVVGVLQPTAGTVRICGHDIRTAPTAAKQVLGYIPDHPYLYQKMSGREYLMFVAELYRCDAANARNNIARLLEHYRLEEWQNELIESYSHGMKQRLATCAALVHEPKVLVIDEPMVGLDPHGARLLKDSLREYAKQGMSIFLSTHSLHVAEEVSHRLAIIHQGKILSVGTVEELQTLAGRQGSGLEEVFIHLTLNR